jgi:hypothetical protein
VTVGLVKQLLEHHAEIKAKDENKWTPILLGLFLNYSFYLNKSFATLV